MGDVENQVRSRSYYFTLAQASATYCKYSWKDFLTHRKALGKNKDQRNFLFSIFSVFNVTFLSGFHILILFPQADSARSKWPGLPKRHTSPPLLENNTLGQKIWDSIKKKSNLFGYLIEVIYGEVWIHLNFLSNLLLKKTSLT